MSTTTCKVKNIHKKPCYTVKFISNLHESLHNLVPTFLMKILIDQDIHYRKSEVVRKFQDPAYHKSICILYSMEKVIYFNFRNRIFQNEHLKLVLWNL